MHISKLLLTIVFCACLRAITKICDKQTCARCDDEALTRKAARTIDSSSLFAWPQALFGNPLSVFPKVWSRGSLLSEWAKNGIMNLLRFMSSLKAGGEPMRMEFGPEDGPRAAEAYQRRFGYRGERLIEQLGNGLGPDVRRRPAPSVFLTPPSSPFRG